MQPVSPKIQNGKKIWKQEIWAMYQIRRARNSLATPSLAKPDNFPMTQCFKLWDFGFGIYFGFGILDLELPCYARLWLFVSIWFQILFHLPHRDAFHLSLTVLVRYRSLKIFSLGAIVAPDSDGISPVPSYLRAITPIKYHFMYRAFTFFGSPFQELSTMIFHRSRLNE